MATNKIVQRTVEEFMADYTPVYNPIYALFMGGARQYAAEVGSVNFNSMTTIGDVRAHRILPKDTEIRQLNAGPAAAKNFKKYFFANQFTVSHLQDQEGTESVIAEVLDEHQKQFDEIFFTGEGTSTGNVMNNGLFWSADPNYILKNPESIAADDTALVELYNLIVSNARQANNLAGSKVIMYYGDDMIAAYDSLMPVDNSPFSSLVGGALQGYTSVVVPSSIVPAGTNGFIIANLDQSRLHYSKLPGLDDNGDNAEKKYSWWNFMMGSNMLEVKASGGIIRQQLTFA